VDLLGLDVLLQESGLEVIQKIKMEEIMIVEANVLF